ncbi:MAG TPA: M14 family zinc carboxypeptidase [Acidimicrobiales bacterium]|nr:M14 family zinc carboxypeptidase [Acidimicrobiales bacterium]
MQEWLAGFIDAVPDFTVFPLVDELVDEMGELASQYPDVASLTRVGTSRLGEPIAALRVEAGPREALAFGGVHPNEPIGGLTALHLARTLCASQDLSHRLGYSWTVVPCIDPDGMRLNEGWFKGPFLRSHYGRHFYRPAGEEQVEWTFPFAYKKAYFDAVLPETVALMRLIDERKPDLMCSLHNGELGGAYYYLSKAVPGIYQELQEIPAFFGLPLDLGEPEVPYVERFADAIYGMIRSEDAYDFAEAAGTDPVASRSGASSASYAARHGTVTLVSELPYWVDPRANRTELVGHSYAALLEGRAAKLGQMVQVLQGTMAAVTHETVTASPFWRASRSFMTSIRSLPDQDEYRAAQPESGRPATIAEEHALGDIVHCFRLRYGGILLRALEGELAVGNGTPAIRREHRKLSETDAGWAKEADRATPMPPAPIRALVATQYGAILVTAAGLPR